ncbi:MAG: indolepyruvate oxidoreductase subunit beta [Candidatus Bathyarchaeia archaeon]
MVTRKVEEFNVLIAGVGGQGNLLSSEIIATAAVIEGFRVRVADVFGAAQRGGSVLSHIRIGEEVYSPVIPQGSADVLLGFEPVECLRASRLLSPSCTAIVNTRPVYPRDVSIGELAYPDTFKIASLLQRLVKKFIYRDFIKLAEKAGSSRTLNVVLVGSLAGLELLPIRKETFLKVIAETVPSGTEEMNIKAFELGYKEVKRETHQTHAYPSL